MDWKEQLKEFAYEQPFELEEKGLNYYVISPDIKVYVKGQTSIAFIDTPLVSLAFPTYVDIVTKENIIGLNYDEFMDKYGNGSIMSLDKVPISRKIFYKLRNYI